MKVKVKCSKCSNEFEIDVNISGKEMNSFGYTVDSKGDIICSFIESNPNTVYNEILKHLLKLYPTENSTGRLNRVLNELKSRGYIVEKNRAYKVLKKG